ncbi:MAG: 4Fe-4S binding protein [Candidatus Tectomicrobia bacterium]|uniref:4Fe-4S binding protein n=1 Tax=Tectimicrobiota bacterium TaxID=2528274 RepID=A0A933GJH2_UNCTE|nr:4Fe-4S binding protein [Candidatus Tectomicrobia bacterium]
MAIRKIIQIDENRCNGCGLCLPACAEGALEIVNGKARLANEIYCDGLGACLGVCPQGALIIEERESADFNQKAMEEHMEKDLTTQKPNTMETDDRGPKQFHISPHSHGGMSCPSANPISFSKPKEEADHGSPKAATPSRLSQWPVQLTLVPVKAPYFDGADLLVSADCVPFAYGGFHEDFLKGKTLVVGCPKLDDIQFYTDKLTNIFKQNNIKSLTVTYMEVPCCSGLAMAVERALKASGKKIPLTEVIMGLKGAIICSETMPESALV